MAPTFYAWSPIVGHKDGKQVNVKVGQKVNQGDLGVSDSDFAEMIAAGAVRSQPYPVPEDQHALVSPTQHVQNIIAGATQVVDLDLSNEDIQAITAVRGGVTPDTADDGKSGDK